MIDAIEREMYIDAGIEHVWSLVSKAGFWVGNEPHFDAVAGEGETVLIVTDAYGDFPVRVETLDPPRYAAYRWASGYPGAQLTEANSTLVEFTLVERDGGVLLQLRESGFATLGATLDFRAARHLDNTTGWESQLDRLRQIAERVPAR